MRSEPGAILANVGLGQDTLSSETGLAEYIEEQMKLIGNHLKDAKFAGPQAAAFPGAEEAYLLFVRHQVASTGCMLHAQTYVRVRKWLGIVTLTALETQVKVVRPDYDAFVRGLRILSDPVSAPAARA